MAKRLKTTSDLRRYLANLVNRVEKGEVEAAKASKIGFLINILAKLIESSDIEQRVAEVKSAVTALLERGLAERKGVFSG